MKSSENPPRRPYRKSRRAAQEAATRLRITEAVVDLHRTVGPVHTTIKEVASRAGVSRMTVYHHFPAERDLVEACSTHWSRAHPMPDPTAHDHVADPAERLTAALRDLYRWYAATEEMMGKVLRDAPVVPALGELMAERWFAHLDRLVEHLSRGVAAESGEAPGEREQRAALRLAVDFQTWRLLTACGLDSVSAAELAARLTARAGNRPPQQRRPGSSSGRHRGLSGGTTPGSPPRNPPEPRSGRRPRGR
jgi:AcrR family transcriptional regulator